MIFNNVLSTPMSQLIVRECWSRDDDVWHSYDFFCMLLLFLSFHLLPWRCTSKAAGFTPVFVLLLHYHGNNEFCFSLYYSLLCSYSVWVKKDIVALLLDGTFFMDKYCWMKLIFYFSCSLFVNTCIVISFLEDCWC